MNNVRKSVVSITTAIWRKQSLECTINSVHPRTGQNGLNKCPPISYLHKLSYFSGSCHSTLSGHCQYLAFSPKFGSCSDQTLKNIYGKCKQSLPSSLRKERYYHGTFCRNIRKLYFCPVCVSEKNKQYSDDSVHTSRCFSCYRNSLSQVNRKNVGNQQNFCKDAEVYSQNERSGDEGKKIFNDIKEDIMTVPNLLTTSRMLASPLLGGLVLYEYYSWALGLFIIAGFTDVMDGYIARNFKNQTSVLGTALDPLADKFLISILTVTLTIVNLIPVPLTALIVGRDIGLVAVGFYLRYISLPPPRTLSRYFDVRYPTTELHPSTISKMNTGVQLTLLTLTLAAPVFDYVDHVALHGLWYLTAATTFLSGVGYVITRNSNVKILRMEQRKKL